MSWLTSFNPDPSWYTWSAHTVTALSTIIFPVGIWCIFKVMPKRTDKLFKRLLASSLTLSYLCQLSISAGTIPLLVFPICGGYPLGFLGYLGISTCFLTGMEVSVIADVTMLTIFLFFYRQHVVVPLARWINAILMIWFIITFAIVPIPSHIALCSNMNDQETKDLYMNEFPTLCKQIPNFWNESVIVFGWAENMYLRYILLYDFYFIIVTIVSIYFFVHRLSFYLSGNTVSEYHRSFHHTLIRSLMAQSFVHYSLMLLPVGIIAASCYWRLELPGLANVCFILIALSDPCGLLTLLLAHRDYRTAIGRFLRTSKNQLNGHIVSVINPPTISGQLSHHSVRRN